MVVSGDIQVPTVHGCFAYTRNRKVWDGTDPSRGGRIMTGSMELARKAGLEAAWQTGFDEFTKDGHRFRWAYDVCGRKAERLIVCCREGRVSGWREKWDYRDRVVHPGVRGGGRAEGDLRSAGPAAPPLPADSIKPNKASAESKAVVRVPVVVQ